MALKRAMMIGLDGADPLVVKRLIEAGRLPGLKRVMDEGVAHESLSMLGAFPTVTPPNWCSLATGNWPLTHGITCFLNHTLGKELDILELNWDARRVESELIWETFESEGKRSIMLNYCQAWPNRVLESENIIIDGTGVTPFINTSLEYQKIVTLAEGNFFMKEIPHYVDDAGNQRIIFGDMGQEVDYTPTDFSQLMIGGSLGGRVDQTPIMECPAVVCMEHSAEDLSLEAVADMVYSPLKELKGWSMEMPGDAREAIVPLNKGLTRRIAVITASESGHYDTISLYGDKKSTCLGQAKLGEWSEWIYDQFECNEQLVHVAYKIRVLDMKEDGSAARFYLSHVVNLDDDTYYYPASLRQEILEKIGPVMVAANIERYTAFGDDIMLESFDQIYDWHIEVTKYLFEKYDDWGLFYTHLHGIDLNNHWFINQAVEGSHPQWQRHKTVIERMYEINDRFVSAMLEYLDGNTAIFITSDHAAVPRSPGFKNPGLAEISGINGKVMNELGYTTVVESPALKGYYSVDWSKTRAVSQRGGHIYLNLKGRDPQGIVDPADYDNLVQQIISDLYNYRDPVQGQRVVSFAMTREEMTCIGMGGEHCGDIYLQLTKDYGNEHAHAPSYVTNHGYSLACLCMMVGAGLKAGQFISRPIRIVDIVPTICHLCGIRQPKDVEGGIIYQALA